MVLVWSLWIRLFHWLLVGGLSVQYLNDGGGDWHEWIGYALALLIVLRIVYGIKTRRLHERWSQFRVTPKLFWAHLKATLKGQLKRSFHHPPQAAFIMLLIFLTTMLTVLTGHIQEIYFFFGEDWVQLLHEYMAYAILALAAFHVFGVLHASRLWKENLSFSMIHGRRRSLDKPDEESH